MNDNNLEFYKNLSVDHFMKLAVMGGFDTYSDIKLAYPYIKNANSILELGAGYGRCIDFYLKNNFKGKITAVELIPKLASFLLEKYEGKVEILQEDIKNLVLKEKVDAALWMWSGFIDFSKEEQMMCMKKIYDLLNTNGKLVLDVPRIGFQTIAQHEDKQNLFFETSYGNLNCFIPNENDIKVYGKESGFKNVIPINYQTTTEKERTIYILEK